MQIRQRLPSAMYNNMEFATTRWGGAGQPCAALRCSARDGRRCSARASNEGVRTHCAPSTAKHNHTAVLAALEVKISFNPGCISKYFHFSIASRALIPHQHNGHTVREETIPLFSKTETSVY